MDEIVFEDPPRSAAGRPRGDDRDAIAHALLSRPGEWARVLTYPTANGAYNATLGIRGRWAAFQPHGWFEAKARTHDGEYRVYARYLGGDS